MNVVRLTVACTGAICMAWFSN